MNDELLTPKEYEILTKDYMAPTIFNFKLNGRLSFQPGQFVQASIPHIGEATFAPCSNPDQKDSFELCIRGCGSTTDALISLLPGDKIKVRGPFGNGWPIEKLKKQDIIMIAGGMGLIPLRPLLYRILKERRKYGRVFLFGGFRTQEHVLFKDDLRDWDKKVSLNIYLEQLTKDTFYKQGLITEPLKEAKFNTKKSLILICGPEIMIPFVLDVLSNKGFRDDQIFISYERRMECGIGICQHCNVGKYLVCKDGPVFRYDQIRPEVNK
jgi:NAD(P)H-flavin reductase